MDNLPAFFGGIVGLLALGVLIALSIYWLLFPWFVYSKLNTIIKSLNDQGKALVKIAGVLNAREDAAQASPKRALPPLPGKERYYIAAGDTIGGPHAADKIRSMLARGTMTQEQVFVLPEGAATWKKIDDVFAPASAQTLATGG